MHPTPSILSCLLAEEADQRLAGNEIDDILFSDSNEIAVFLKSRPLNPYILRFDPRERRLKTLRKPQDSHSLLRIDSYWGKVGGEGYRDLPTKVFIDLLLEAFVSEIRLEDPAAIAALEGKPCIYVGNHQTYIESVLIGYLLTAINKNPFLGVAKVAHAGLWLGSLYAMLSSYPGIKIETEIYLVDRDNPSSLLQSITDLKHFLKERRKSVFVHLEGRRQRRAYCEIEKVSSLWADLSMETDAPIVPLKFVGGLPPQDLGRKFDFPYGYGKQSILIGAPISPQILKSMPLKERTALIKDRINGLKQISDEPKDAGGELAMQVKEFMERQGMEEDQAVFLSLVTRLNSNRSGTPPLGGLSQAASALLRGEQRPRIEVTTGERGLWLQCLGKWLFRNANPSFETTA